MRTASRAGIAWMGTTGDALVKFLRCAAVVGVVLATASCASLLRTDPFIHGTIVGAGDGWLDVRHKSGRVVRVVITPTTVVAQSTPSAVAPDLRPGLRTTITLDGTGGSFVARQADVFGRRSR